MVDCFSSNTAQDQKCVHLDDPKLLPVNVDAINRQEIYYLINNFCTVDVVQNDYGDVDCEALPTGSVKQLFPPIAVTTRKMDWYSFCIQHYSVTFISPHYWYLDEQLNVSSKVLKSMICSVTVRERRQIRIRMSRSRQWLASWYISRWEFDWAYGVHPWQIFCSPRLASTEWVSCPGFPSGGGASFGTISTPSTIDAQSNDCVGRSDRSSMPDVRSQSYCVCIVLIIVWEMHHGHAMPSIPLIV